MEVKKFNHLQWFQNHAISENLLFNSPEFVDLISSTYHKKLTWYVVYDSTVELVSFPILHSGRDASLTTHFFYQAIRLSDKFSEEYFQKSWSELIQELKNDFDSIDIKFAPYVEDISPFTYKGFEYIKRKTSVVDLLDFPKYSENVKRSLKKANAHQLLVHTHINNSEIISEQVKDMLKYGLGKKHADKFPIWFNGLLNAGSAIIFELKENNARIGSSLYLFDKEQAYLIATMGGTEESGGQAYLYDQAFRYFRELGLKRVDLLGANIPSVAMYKSKLGGEIQEYFQVSYRKYKTLSRISSILKALAKRMLKSIRFINK